MFMSACGRKGDPVRPAIPQPEPLRNVSVSVTTDAIGVSWDAPAFYDTGKPLDVMRDIETMTISRKQESSTDHRWDFSLSRDGWGALGQTLPVKWSQGTLRAASQGDIACIASPEKLDLPAEHYRYVSLNLWTKYAERAYIAFLTSDDTTWDIDPGTGFQPVVHTSFLSYRRLLATRKLKALPLLPQSPTSTQAREYLVDMGEVAGWTGTIQRIGVVVYTSAPETGNLELGLEDFTLLDTPLPPASLYNSSPWGFWQDEEGWRTRSQDTIIGSAGGALFLENGRGPILAMSAPGLRIPWNTLQYIQIRMQAAEEKEAYILLRSAAGPAFERWSDAELTTPSATVLPVLFQAAGDFQVLTVVCPDLPDGVGELSQIGLYFPEKQPAPILIDYIAPSQSMRVSEALAPLLLQKTMPPLPDIAKQVRQQLVNRNPRFDVAYETLDSDAETFRDENVTLVSVSPRNPAPIILREDGGFTFHDTGNANDDEREALPFKRGERYTYTVELTDQRGQSSVLPEALSVKVPFIPSAPVLVSAAVNDGEVHLNWQRPFLDSNGEKIRTLDGYHIYRTTISGQYAGAPLYEAATNDTAFIDANVVNGTTYYYVVQAVASVTDSTVVGGTSLEVSATPNDTQAPPVPLDLTSVYLAGTVKLFWNFSASRDWKGFNVYRGPSADGPFQKINSQPVLQPAYDDASAAPNQHYFYYVSSIDTAEPPNESQASNIVQVTTKTR